MSKAELMAEGELKTEIVPMGDGKHAIVSELSALDLSDLWKMSEIKTDKKGEIKSDKKGEVDMKKFNPLLLAFCIVDEKGKRIFDNEDADLLGGMCAGFNTKLMPAAKRLNGLMGDEGNDLEATNDASSIGE